MATSNVSLKFTQSQSRPLKLQKIDHTPFLCPSTKLWGSIPKIHLTKNALNELNRLNRRKKNIRVQPHFDPNILPEQLETIRRLAKEGGPDLTDLRGFPERNEFVMESVEPSQSSRPTMRSGTGHTTKTTGPYDDNFMDMLEARGIFFAGTHRSPNREPLNLEELIERANEPRATVTPLTVPNTVFDTFVMTTNLAKLERKIVKHVVPLLEGGICVENQGFQDTAFSNLDQFAVDTIEQRALVQGTPDRCYGSPFERLCEKVREDLNGVVVPTTELTNPIAPNFFLELKGPKGNRVTADLQARYYGALGERGQIALRSWGHDEPVLDGMAHTIACTYVSGTLRFYSIHAARSSDPNRRIDYYMHMIDVFIMDASVFKFRKAIAAYQNLQDFAEEKRNEAIEIANAKALENQEASS